MLKFVILKSNKVFFLVIKIFFFNIYKNRIDYCVLVKNKGLENRSYD